MKELHTARVVEVLINASGDGNDRGYINVYGMTAPRPLVKRLPDPQSLPVIYLRDLYSYSPGTDVMDVGRMLPGDSARGVLSDSAIMHYFGLPSVSHAYDGIILSTVYERFVLKPQSYAVKSGPKETKKFLRHMHLLVSVFKRNRT